MRIVIDMQGAQSESRHRGIGYYTLSFVRALIANSGEHEIILALNGMLSETVEVIRNEFQDILPQGNIKVWHAVGPVKECDSGNDSRRQVAEITREAFLASLKPDIIHIQSLFEGFVDDSITSIARLDNAIPTSVTLYDLIPLQNKEEYFEQNMPYWQHYEKKINHLKRAALYLAISDFAKEEAMECLGLSSDQIVNISCASNPFFHPIGITDAERQLILKTHRIDKSFLLYVGAADVRKNIPRLIQAYSMLPAKTRSKYQLVLAGKWSHGEIEQIRLCGADANLSEAEVVITGQVSREDLRYLYNLCTLFVFPSWHEGFGLPVLEAMSCGAPVIAANTTSLPEVIGRNDVLFDPFNTESIAAKITEILSDGDRMTELKEYGVQRAKLFSWDQAAQKAITAYEAYLDSSEHSNPTVVADTVRPKMAYFSPLPPEYSGIADYSAELLPYLAEYYDIDVIVNQEIVENANITDYCQINTLQKFIEHSAEYDRILYQVGNSPLYHSYMLDVLPLFPGVITLHDFYLSGLKSHLQQHSIKQWLKDLYYSHGYTALIDYIRNQDIDLIKQKYPCSLDVIQNSLGVIMHSESTARMIGEWHSVDNEHVVAIPQLRGANQRYLRSEARKLLGIAQDAILVCSFGIIARTKMSERLLDSWLQSTLHENSSCSLVFVGERYSDPYTSELAAKVTTHNCEGRVSFTDRVSEDVYHQYLAASDICVQLRTQSRGETSRAILDCMNYGKPVIINANGSMADFDDTTVYKLPDEFFNNQLVDALEFLASSDDARVRLGEAARDAIATQHDPKKCAKRYRRAIENYYLNDCTNPVILAKKHLSPLGILEVSDLAGIADTLALSFPPHNRVRQLFFDISELVCLDRESGIQRVVRSYLREWLRNPPKGYRLEPVYATKEASFKYARQFTMRFLGYQSDFIEDEPIDYYCGDIFFSGDFNIEAIIAQEKLLEDMQAQGVRIVFFLYDILPITSPDFFPEQVLATFLEWLHAVSASDAVVCDSKTTALDYSEWLKNQASDDKISPQINWVHLGADTDASSPTFGIPEDSIRALYRMERAPTFLMVGTVEPRKGHAQVLEAFHALWRRGHDYNLVIVGKQGWNVEQLTNDLRYHPENGSHLFWLEGISDEYLEHIYSSSTCLIAASFAEGFGLPLIEAAQHGLPIISRDIAVFREVAGEYAWYFDTESGEELADSIEQWQEQHEEGKTPSSAEMPYLTWQQSTEQLTRIVCGDQSR
jgi:glycosyltransferase involved in cell wall biosynthesis